jgi:hypothetical protein
VSCHLLDYFGDDPAPPSMADEALRIARDLPDDGVAADALAQLCWLSFEHGDLPRVCSASVRTTESSHGDGRHRLSGMIFITKLLCGV